MKPAHIALLTDFGTADPYVASLKGVILSAVPRIRITDISHEIPRHDVTAAAYMLRTTAAWFPAGTIFVCVVDPGVGTTRRILCLTLRGRTYLAPDNGILERFAERPRDGRWYALRPPSAGTRISPTFHGRDIFAPAAARLAGGARMTSVALPIPAPRPIRLLGKVPRQGKGSVEGLILHVDRFGNIVTNLTMSGGPPASLRVRIGRRNIRRICSTYDEAPLRSPFIIMGSSGLLEISVKRGNAARALCVKAGDPVRAIA